MDHNPIEQNRVPMDSDQRKALAGRSAIVTGSAHGIGRRLSIALADSGARVAGIDVSEQSETADVIREAGGEFLGLAVDVTDPDAVDEGIASVAAQLGGPHILVANAGIFPTTPFDSLTVQEWRRILSVNLDGVFYAVRAAVPRMKKAGWGRIVIMSSSTVWIGVPEMVPYVTTKMGLIGFTRSLATELGPTGITVNAITPGLLETETALASPVGQRFDAAVEKQAIKRRGGPDDLVSTLMYLCDPGSDFITGQTINVDGGRDKH